MVTRTTAVCPPESVQVNQDHAVERDPPGQVHAEDFRLRRRHPYGQFSLALKRAALRRPPGQAGRRGDHEDMPMTAPSAAARGAAPQRQRMGGLLRQHDFRLFWTGETISQLGDTMARVAMPLLAVLVLHASTFVVTLLTATAYLPWLLVGLPAGAWVDRIRCRPLMIACDLVAAVLYGSLPVAAWLGVLTIGQVIVVALLAGGAGVFFSTAYQVYLPSIVATGELVEGNAKLQGSASAAAIGGPGAAGLLAGTLGAAAALLANAVSFGVSAVCLLRIRGCGARTTPAQASRMGLRREIADGVRYVARDPYLRPLTIWASLVNLGLTGYGALAVVFLVRTVGLAAGP